MKLTKTLKLIGILGTFSMAVGCAGPAEKPAEPAEQAPVVSEPVQETAPVVEEAKMTSYEVNKGDHLWGIAGKASVYGNPYNWPLIYKANSDKIKDADLIHPGQVFDIKMDPSDAESAAAVNHAKTRGSWSIGTTEESDKAYLAQ